MQAPPANSDQGKQTGATGRLAHETEVGKSERQFIEAVRRSIDAVADRVGGKKELARLLGVAENTLHNWYNGTNTPKGEILNQLVVRFGVDPRFLLTGEGEPVPRAAPITMSPVLLDIAVRHLCESLKSLSAMSALLAPLMNGSARHELALQASGMAADLGRVTRQVEEWGEAYIRERFADLLPEEDIQKLVNSATMIDIATRHLRDMGMIRLTGNT